jgi:predicted NUDIX family NTP pyrophosphohydrolase
MPTLTPSERRVLDMLQSHPGAWLWVGENEAIWRVYQRMIARGLLRWAEAEATNYVRLP